jgi:hypothetical protein
MLVPFPLAKTPLKYGTWLCKGHDLDVLLCDYVHGSATVPDLA